MQIQGHLRPIHTGRFQQRFYGFIQCIIHSERKHMYG